MEQRSRVRRFPPLVVPSFYAAAPAEPARDSDGGGRQSPLAQLGPLQLRTRSPGPHGRLQHAQRVQLAFAARGLLQPRAIGQQRAAAATGRSSAEGRAEGALDHGRAVMTPQRSDHGVCAGEWILERCAAAAAAAARPAPLLHFGQQAQKRGQRAHGGGGWRGWTAAADGSRSQIQLHACRLPKWAKSQ